jgi:hypothetical protein
MRPRFYCLLLAVITASLLLPTIANAHELTAKKAKAALKPLADSLIPTINPEIAKKLPGASVAKSDVRECRVSKSKHRASCAVTFSIAGATTGETECVIEGVVKFRNARSKDLKVAIQGSLICYFEVPPP